MEHLLNFFIPKAEAHPLLHLARHLASVGFSKVQRRLIITKLPKKHFDGWFKLKKMTVKVYVC